MSGKQPISEKPGEDIVRHLAFHLRRAGLAYENYLSNNHSFLYAKAIKRANDSVMQLIIHHGASLPIALQHDALEILAHLEVWRDLWIQAADQTSPALSDKFVFDNKHTFPRAACDRLLSYCSK